MRDLMPSVGAAPGESSALTEIDARADYGARGDARCVAGSMQVASNQLHADLTSDDVGRRVIVPGAGAARLCGDLREDSTEVTHVTALAGFGHGSLVEGPGIEPGTRIVVGANTHTLTLTRPAGRTCEGAELMAQSALLARVQSVRDGIATLSLPAAFAVAEVEVTIGTDDAPALLAALTAGIEQHRVVHIPAGRYMCVGPICRLLSYSGAVAGPIVRGDGVGVTVLLPFLPGEPHEAEPLFGVRGAEGHKIAAPLVGRAGSMLLRLPDTKGLQVGQQLHLSDPGQPQFSRGVPWTIAGEVVRVREVLDGEHVFLFGGLEFTYGETAVYQRPAHVPGFSLCDMTIRNPAPSTQSAAARAIKLDVVCDVSVRRVRFEQLDAAAMRFAHVLRFRVQDCEFDNLQNVGTVNNPYGVLAADWCTSGIVSGCSSDGGCHLFTTGGRPGSVGAHHIVVANCMASNHTKAAFDTHAGTRAVTFVGNHVHGSAGPGFQIRAPDCQVIEPVVSGLGRGIREVDGHSSCGVYFANGADRSRVHGGWISQVDHGVIVRLSDDVEITGVRMRGVRRHGVRVDAVAGRPSPRGVRIDDVEIDCERDAIGILFEAWDNTNELRRITCRGGRMAISGAEPPTQEAAATLAPLPSSDTWVIAGDAEIESIPGDMTQFGRHLTLVFRGTCTINSRRAGNIRLAGELRTAPGTTLCLVYDGEGWVETSRTCEGEREAGPKSSSARFRSDAEATENARAARGAPTGPCSPA